MIPPGAISAMSETQYRQLFLALPSPHMILDASMRFLAANDAYLAMVQRRRDQLIGRHVFEAFPDSEERVRAFREAFERTLAGEVTVVERRPFFVQRSETGEGTVERWFTCHHVPLRDADGRPCGVVQHSEDVTGEVLAERLQAALSGEFDHRVKNLLATVASIARRTAQSATSTAAFVEDFEARIQAMARTHALLVDGGWDRLSLEELVEGALAPFRGAGRAVAVGGPAVELSGAQAQSLGLALHELAVNAVKHGALGAEVGRLAVSWSVLPAVAPIGAGGGRSRMLELSWCETGLSGIAPPAVTGFGTTLLERVLPAEVEGSILREFLPHGLSCTIRLPLARAARGRGRGRGAWLLPGVEGAPAAASPST